jgi:hypothetical protein
VTIGGDLVGEFMLFDTTGIARGLCRSFHVLAKLLGKVVVQVTIPGARLNHQRQFHDKELSLYRLCMRNDSEAAQKN